MNSKRVLIVLILICSYSCAEIGINPNQRNGEMELSSENLFDNIEPGNHNKNECTPDIDEDFIGLRINAPKIIYYTPMMNNPITGAFGKVIICGIYSLDAKFVSQIGNIVENVTLVAIDTQTHIPYVGKAIDDHPRDPDPILQQYSPEELEDLNYVGFFNINILEFLDLPEKPSTYQVFVTLKEYKSNVVTITLKPHEVPR